MVVDSKINKSNHKFVYLGRDFYTLCKRHIAANCYFKKAIKSNTIPEKVHICTACHGVDGRHVKENVPLLGDRTYEDLIVVIQRVKDTYSLQTLLGHALSDEDMHDIATYFSSFK